MLELEVVDVEALRAECLEDPCEDTGPVRDVHAEAVQRARVLVCSVEHLAPVLARLADPAGEEAGVAVPECRLELLHAAAMLHEGLGEGDPVVEEDVHPDPGVGACDAGHVAQRAPCCGERIVPVDARRARLVEQHVRERMREMAGHGDKPVVRPGIDRKGSRPERGRERVRRAVPGRLRGGERREEPGRALEQVGARARRPARLRAADRMPADEARIVSGRPADGCLRRARVGHGRVVGSEREHVVDDRRDRCDGNRDEDELRFVQGGLERRCRRHGAPLGRDLEHSGVLVPAGDRRESRAVRSETRGRADESGADDREPHAVARRLA